MSSSTIAAVHHARWGAASRPIVALLLGGCLAGEPASLSIKRAGGIAAAVGGVLIVSSAALVIGGDCWGYDRSQDICHDPKSGTEKVLFWSGVTAIAAGLIVVLGGLAAEASEAHVANAQQRAGTDHVTSANAAMAERLTMSAHVVATRGDCKMVAIIAKRVEALDLAYYDQVFRSDASISRCQAAPPSEPN